jgi:hypothetical protein
MPSERESEPSDADDVDLDAVLDDFADRAGPDPAREPGVDPSDPGADERDGEGEPGGAPPPP